MRTFVLQILWQVVIFRNLCQCENCAVNPDHQRCTTTEQTSNTTPSATQTPTSSTSNQTTLSQNTTFTTTTIQQAGTNVTTTEETSSVDTHQTTTDKSTSSSKTIVIVAASVWTCVAVILLVLFFFIRRRHILTNCNSPNIKPKDEISTSFNNNMFPDIEGTSDDNKYAEIPLDNLESIKNEDNVYQTIDPIQELESEIDDNYSHTSGKALPLTNTSYSHIAGDFQNKRVVPDYTHIAKLEETQKRNLKLKTNESDTSYDIIGKAKFEVSENQNVMEPTYNHTHNDTSQTGISTSDVDSYSHLHVSNKYTQDNETMTNNQYNKHDEPVIDNPIFLHKENGLCLKEGDAEPKFVVKTEEKEHVAFVKLPEASKFSLKEIDEENSVDHQYFVLENVDKTEDNESPVVIKQPVANTFSLTENKKDNAVDHQYFVLEKMDK